MFCFFPSDFLFNLLLAGELSPLLSCSSRNKSAGKPKSERLQTQSQSQSHPDSDSDSDSIPAQCHAISVLYLKFCTPRYSTPLECQPPFSAADTRPPLGYIVSHVCLLSVRMQARPLYRLPHHFVSAASCTCNRDEEPDVLISNKCKLNALTAPQTSGPSPSTATGLVSVHIAYIRRMSSRFYHFIVGSQQKALCFPATLFFWVANTPLQHRKKRVGNNI